MLLARSMAQRLFPSLSDSGESKAAVTSEQNAGMPWRHELHPDALFADYLATSSADRASRTISADMARSFRQLLNVYEVRQSVDDNFTIRVTHSDTGELLEIITLEDERRAFQSVGSADWDAIDRKRRKLTRELIRRYERSGTKKADVSVRWGRRNQLDEAHARDLPFLEHEISLARRLGLSLLATEIGTVETFNRDDLTSRAGARSRYQIMPDKLRRFGVSRYRLTARSGAQIRVREERHPLLVMEPAMILLRAYGNAVGHELPGISAYHAGPYNIFKMYRRFLTDQSVVVTPGATVASAFVWGLTDGYAELRRTTSFRSYSRGYVPTVYGSLKASEPLVPDTSRTLYAELIQLQPGESAYLSELLQVLSQTGGMLDWRVPGEHAYDRFRALNPHIDLPARDTVSTAAPKSGDIVLVSKSAGHPVRFFLPLGSARLVSRSMPGLIDPLSVRRFDRSALESMEEEYTALDRAYEQLVGDVERFGFTFENRTKIQALAAAMSRKYEEFPSDFRRRQRDVAEMHELIWRSDHFENLAGVATAARGRLRMSGHPPDEVVPGTQAAREQDLTGNLD